MPDSFGLWLWPLTSLSLTPLCHAFASLLSGTPFCICPCLLWDLANLEECVLFGLSASLAAMSLVMWPAPHQSQASALVLEWLVGWLSWEERRDVLAVAASVSLRRVEVSFHSSGIWAWLSSPRRVKCLCHGTDSQYFRCRIGSLCWKHSVIVVWKHS